MGLRPHLWAAIVPVTCPVHDTCLHETDLQSVFQGVFCWFSLSLFFFCGARFRWAAAAIVPVTCPVHATCIHETDLKSVWPGVLLIDMCLVCASLGFNVILAMVR